MLMLMLIAVICFSFLPTPQAQLQVGFYDTLCPAAELIVRDEVQKAMNISPGAASGLLRLHFHDCFVRVSDYIDNFISLSCYKVRCILTRVVVAVSLDRVVTRRFCSTRRRITPRRRTRRRTQACGGSRSSTAPSHGWRRPASELFPVQIFWHLQRGIALCW